MDKEMETLLLAGIKAIEDQSRGYQAIMGEQSAALREAIALCRDLSIRVSELSERIAVVERRLEEKAG